MKILMVHGINAPLDAASIREEWTRALMGEVTAQGFETSVMHYADVFAQLPSSQGYLGEGERDLLSAWAREATGVPPQGFGEDAVDQLAAFLERSLSGVPRPLIRRGMKIAARQAYAYLHRGHIRAAIQLRFAESVRSFGPDVIFAHSLGSIVAYEGLAAVDDLPRPVHLVTAGSPLGTRRAILGVVNPPPDQGLPDEAVVKKWLNVRHPGDLVAAAGPLSPHFPAVSAEMEIDVPLDQCHSAVAYLSAPEVRCAVLAST